MESLKQRWKKLPATVRKPIVLIIGSIVVVGGIILLPLPGPGWVIIFAGFALLATEFAFAETVRDWLVNIFKKAGRYLANIWRKVRGKPISKKSQKTEKK